jgi:hypothetical protein
VNPSRSHNPLSLTIYPLNPSLMLLFPHGDAGFHSGIKMRVVDPARPPTRENISVIEYYTINASIVHMSVFAEMRLMLSLNRILQRVFFANGVDVVSGIDEVEEYVRSRYLSSCESFWRLLGFEIHGKYPSVERLCVHLPGMNFVTVSDESDLTIVVDEPSSSQSQLTEWFIANQHSSSGHAPDVL